MQQLRDIDCLWIMSAWRFAVIRQMAEPLANIQAVEAARSSFTCKNHSSAYLSALSALYKQIQSSDECV